MNLRTTYAWQIADKPTSDALETLATRANLIFNVEHDGETGLHTFTGVPTPFDRTMFSSPGMAVTAIAEADVRQYRVWKLGKLCIVHFFLGGGFAVAGGSNEIVVRLPAGIVAADWGVGACWVGVGLPGMFQVTPGGNSMSFFRADLVAFAAGAVQVRAQVQFQMV